MNTNIIINPIIKFSEYWNFFRNYSISNEVENTKKKPTKIKIIGVIHNIIKINNGLNDEIIEISEIDLEIFYERVWRFYKWGNPNDIKTPWSTSWNETVYFNLFQWCHERFIESMPFIKMFDCFMDNQKRSKYIPRIISKARWNAKVSKRNVINIQCIALAILETKNSISILIKRFYKVNLSTLIERIGEIIDETETKVMSVGDFDLPLYYKLGDIYFSRNAYELLLFTKKLAKIGHRKYTSFNLIYGIFTYSGGISDEIVKSLSNRFRVFYYFISLRVFGIKKFIKDFKYFQLIAKRIEKLAYTKPPKPIFFDGTPEEVKKIWD